MVINPPPRKKNIDVQEESFFLAVAYLPKEAMNYTKSDGGCVNQDVVCHPHGVDSDAMECKGRRPGNSRVYFFWPRFLSLFIHIE